MSGSDATWTSAARISASKMMRREFLFLEGFTVLTHLRSVIGGSLSLQAKVLTFSLKI